MNGTSEKLPLINSRRCRLGAVALCLAFALGISCLRYKGVGLHHIVSCELGKCLKKCITTRANMDRNNDVCYETWMAGTFQSSEAEIKAGHTPEAKLAACLLYANLCFDP